jgi:autotransporter-associated beta strand protein
VSGAYTLAGGGGGITLSGAPAFDCVVDGTVSAALKGTGSLLKTGAGMLTLSGVNTFSGGTTVSNGTLQMVTGCVLPGNVTNYAALLFNRSDSVSFGGVISGSGSVTMQGGGTLSVTNANTFSGGTTISGGTISLGNGAGGLENVNGLGTGMATVNTGGTLQLDNAAGTTTFSIANPVALNGGTVLSIDNYEHLTGAVNVTADGGTLSQYYNTKSLWIDGQLTGSGTLTINNNGSGSYPPYTVIHFSNPANTYSGQINVTGNAVTIDNTYALSNATLNVTGAGSGGPIIWGSGVSSIVLGGLSGAYNIANGGKALSVGNNNSRTTYSGILSGTGTVTKLGTGTFTLSGANTYTGATTVSNGMFLVNGSLASGVIVAANGLLGGVGVISGAVTNTGTLTAGNNSIGTLTISNKLILASGSTTLLKLSKNGGGLTNDLLFVSGALTNGGSLIVTNLGTNALALGDSVTLFKAGTYAGGFANLTLPVLTSGLSWNTNMLATNGTLTVVVSRYTLT